MTWFIPYDCSDIKTMTVNASSYTVLLHFHVLTSSSWHLPLYGSLWTGGHLTKSIMIEAKLRGSYSFVQDD